MSGQKPGMENKVILSLVVLIFLVVLALLTAPTIWLYRWALGML